MIKTLEVEVAVKPDKKGSMVMRYDVKGTMDMIRHCMPDQNTQDLLDEYAKFYMLDKLGVKTYPLEKED